MDTLAQRQACRSAYNGICRGCNCCTMRARWLHLFAIQLQPFSKQVLRGHVVRYRIQIPNSLPQEDACSRLVVHNRTYRLPEVGEHLLSNLECGRSLKLKLVFLWVQIVTSGTCTPRKKRQTGSANSSHWDLTSIRDSTSWLQRVYLDRWRHAKTQVAVWFMRHGDQS